MYWGIVGVSLLSFVCSMELIPEINEQMKLVPFTEDFKMTMTATMVLDYAACWAIEVVLKRLFSDYRPRDIATRRPDQLEKENARKAEELRLKKAEEERIDNEKVAALEAKLRARREQIQGWIEGRPAAAQ
jgi:manganese-transporting P-type ATPase